MTRRFPLAAGAVAAVALLAFYLGLLVVAEGRDFAARQARQDAPYLAFLMPSFGLVIGLVLHARERAAAHAGRMAGTSTGLSATAVVACCAHFVPTLLPVVGVSAVASFLAAWKAPLLVLAIAVNLGMAAYVLRHLRRMDAMETGGPPG